MNLYLKLRSYISGYEWGIRKGGKGTRAGFHQFHYYFEPSQNGLFLEAPQGHKSIPTIFDSDSPRLNKRIF
jgi:hypothetical protein